MNAFTRLPRRGFTEAQARFLKTVMLHSGCASHTTVRTLCGIVHGAKTRKVCATLVRDKYASMYDCRQSRAHLPPPPARTLRNHWETDSGLRRRLTINRAIQRLMVLDAIVEDPDLVWLATADEKAKNLSTLTTIAPSDLPRVSDVPKHPDRDDTVELPGRVAIVLLANVHG